MDIGKVKENVRKMAAQNAPMQDIDGYIKAAGYTVEDVRAYKPLPQITPREEKPLSPYSGLDKTKYFLRSLGDAAAFGMGDIAAGVTNAGAELNTNFFRSLLRPLGLAGEGVNIRDKATGERIKPGPSGLDKKSVFELFKEGRADFVNEQNDFKRFHPALNTGGEIAGGLITGIGGASKLAGSKALNKLGKAGYGALTGAGGGAVYGFGSGLTADADKLDISSGAKGAGLGALTGAAAGGAIYGTGKAFNAGKNFFFNRGGRAYDKLNKASNGLLDSATNQGRTFVDEANKKSLRVISGANLVDDEASEILNNYGNRRMQQHKINTENLIDALFGPKSYETVLKETAEKSKNLYDKLYEKAMSKGSVKIDWEPDLIRFLKEVRANKDIASAIEKYPSNHMRVLDQIKQAIDARITKLQNYEGGLGVANLQGLKERLLKQVDKQNQYYRIARQVFEREKLFERGAQKGAKIFEDSAGDIAQKVNDMGRAGKRPDFGFMRERAAKLKSPGAAERRLADIDTLELVYNSMTEAEREGFKAGAAKKLRTLAESSGAEYENLALKLFGLNRMRKLKAAGMDVSRIEPAVQREVHAARNMRNLLRGSQTAERGEDIGNMLTGPISYAKKFAAAKINQLTGIKPADIARIATDPGYAALMRLKAQAARGEIPFIEIGGRGGAAFGSITGPLTSKEKDLYRKQVRKNLMSNARGKTFYSKNGEGIKFNRAGIDKGMSATSKTDKLLMLDNAPKISSGAVPLPFEYIKDPYIKTMAAPVSADGRKDIALITLEAQKNKPAFFHNINPISYWAWKYGGFKKGIPSKSSWYQGKGQKNAPRFAHPAYKSGAMPKGDNNIANNNKKVNALRKSQKAYKMGDVFKDGSILALRPFSLGYNMRAGKKEKPYRRGDVFKVFENR